MPNLGAHHWLLIACGVCLISGAGFYWQAVRKGKALGDVLLGTANALHSAGAPAHVIFFLQPSVRDQAEKTRSCADYQTQVLLAADLTGFSPAPLPARRKSYHNGKCNDPHQSAEEKAD